MLCNMIKGTKILLFLLIIPLTGVFSQQLSHQVLVPLAGVVSDATISYSQTVGETAVQIISCSPYIFTQGFQQPRMQKEAEDTINGSGIRVYPNPVSDYVYIELEGDEARTFKIEIVNITGTIVYSANRVFYEQFWYKEQYDVGYLIRGFYLIRISSEDRIINRIFKIEKI